MKPDWDKLGQHYADSSSVLIVDVDCTADGQSTCQRMGVQGYPTIKYYMAGDKKGQESCGSTSTTFYTSLFIHTPIFLFSSASNQLACFMSCHVMSSCHPSPSPLSGRPYEPVV